MLMWLHLHVRIIENVQNVSYTVCALKQNQFAEDETFDNVLDETLKLHVRTQLQFRPINYGFV